MRTIIPFDENWLFLPKKVSFDHPDSEFEPVTLPHSNKCFDHRLVLEDEYQFESTYRKNFMRPEALDGQKVFLDFDGVMQSAKVYINEEAVGEHAGGFTPFSVEVTKLLQPGQNTVSVSVDSRESNIFPPNGFRLDYLPFGGLYRSVWLRMVSPTHLTRVFVRPKDVLTKPRLAVDFEVSEPQMVLTVEATLLDGQRELARQSFAAAGGTFEIEGNLDVELWSLQRPKLYALRLDLLKDGQPLDRIETHFGFRTAEFGKDGSFYLNGQPLKLIGLNRHQTYPFIGAAAPARLQQQDAEILKYELGCNIVRTSHYPQSPAFLDRCDEIGLLVLEEIPGWQFIGNEAWQEYLLQAEREMILRDRNHPSIILWGVRINESPDEDALYMRTNALAHELDPTRQTGGVRNFNTSSFLEDVYTFNDFSLELTEPRHVPHLISEYAGHMFPTKAWDNEDRLIEHALIHARKQDGAHGHPRIAGAIGWCAFDYHTHPEFGSGDRICHHGVMDLFRLPKWAAWFYRSQKDPADEIVLKAATYWTHGDRSGGGNNPLTVFSNCDEIEIFIGGQQHGGRLKPNRASFAHLPHPPFQISWPLPYNPWGEPSGDLKVIGYLAGKPVAQQEIAADQRPRRLSLRADSAELRADGSDMTRLIVSIDDTYGNPLPYQMRVVHLSIQGPGELIGENPLVLVSPQAACLVKSSHKAGRLMVTAKAAGFEPAEVAIEIKA